MDFSSYYDTLLRRLWLGRLHYPAVTVAYQLGVFSLLSEESLTATDIAERLSISKRGSIALLTMLSSLGLITKADEQYVLNDFLRIFLLPKSQFYWGPILKANYDTLHHQMLRDSLLRDEFGEQTNNDSLINQWKAGVLDTKSAERFIQPMHTWSIGPALFLAERVDFDGVEHLLDLGGGSGVYCIMLAKHYLDMKFTIIDLPTVCKVAERYVSNHGLQDRIQTIGLDMFKSKWPKGHDSVLLSNVLHNWNAYSGDVDR